MATVLSSLTITKVSAVLFFTIPGVTNPKSYFSATGKYQAADDNTTLLIQVFQGGNSVPDEYIVAYQNLTVGSSVPPNMNTAKVLLNAIFGT
jgi:hypothetical protein